MVPAVGVMVDDERFVPLRVAAPDLPGTLRGILELGEDALTRAPTDQPTIFMRIAASQVGHRQPIVRVNPVVDEDDFR